MRNESKTARPAARKAEKEVRVKKTVAVAATRKSEPVIQNVERKSPARQSPELTKKPGENAAIAGVLTGLAAMLYVKFATSVPFTWWVMIGSGTTFGAGYLSSFLIPGARIRDGNDTERTPNR